MDRRHYAVLLLAALMVATSVGRAAAQTPFTVGPVTAQPGTTASGTIDVPPLGGDKGTTIPISVIHGSRPGPVLALVAGMHGMEYTSIVALQRLRRSIDPKTIAGTIIMVHVANMPSFLGRTIYYSPVDGKNLNRVFPGKADGTISERIADVLTREVVDRATHLLDLHCGDGNESLRPYVYWITTGPPEVAAAGKQLALAFGLDHIVIDNDRPGDREKSIYLSNTAILRGKPALTAESGALAQTDDASIANIERGVGGVMKAIKMTTAGPDPVASPVWIGRTQVLTAGVTGVLFPLVERGKMVASGDVIARINDFHGTVVEEVKAPFAGEVLYIVGTPPVSRGEPVAFVGARTDTPPQ